MKTAQKESKVIDQKKVPLEGLTNIRPVHRRRKKFLCEAFRRVTGTFIPKEKDSKKKIVKPKGNTRKKLAKSQYLPKNNFGGRILKPGAR